MDWTQLTDPSELLHPLAQRAVIAFYPPRTGPGGDDPAAKRARGRSRTPGRAFLTSLEVGEVFHTSREEGSDALRKKVQDREIKWYALPEDQEHLHEEAMQTEWSSWIKYRCVKVLTKQESDKIRQTVDHRNILGTDWHFKDKNSAFRTPENNLEVVAKARLTAQGQRERAALNGLVKLDSPTAQRVSFNVMLQITASRGWGETTAVADIKCAFLQGKGREEQGSTTKLYLRQPRSRGLPGLEEGQLLEVLKSVYGLPDAARAWFDALVEVLV